MHHVPAALMCKYPIGDCLGQMRCMVLTKMTSPFDRLSVIIIFFFAVLIYQRRPTRTNSLLFHRFIRRYKSSTIQFISYCWYGQLYLRRRKLYMKMRPTHTHTHKHTHTRIKYRGGSVGGMRGRFCFYKRINGYEWLWSVSCLCVPIYIFVFVYYSIHPFFFFLSGRILLKKMKMNKRYSGDADFCLLSL